MVNWSGGDFTVDALMRQFTPMMEAQTVKEWSNVYLPDRALEMDDLKQVALFSMWRFARDYENWCEEYALDPSNLRIFWHNAKKRARWDLLEFLDNKKGGVRNELHLDAITDAAEDAAQFFTQLRIPRHDSLLQQGIVGHFRNLLPRERLLIALRFYEEMPGGDMAPLFEIDATNCLSTAKRAARRLQFAATTEVLNTELPHRRGHTRWSPPDKLQAWIRRNYNLTPDEYTHRVGDMFAIDVGYLVDVLDLANGHITRRFTTAGAAKIAANRNVTPEQVQAIRDELARGTPQTVIAKTLGVGRSTVGQIHRGEGLYDVA